MNATVNISHGPQRNSDPIDLLPPTASAKLIRLRDSTALARVVLEATMDGRDAAIKAKDAARLRIHQLMLPRNGDKALPTDSDHPGMLEAKKQLAIASAELERLAATFTAQEAVWKGRSSLRDTVEKWLFEGRGKLIDNDFEVPSLRKGESSILDAIEGRRRRGRELAADLHQTRCAPVPSADAKLRMRAQIEALAEAGAPSVGGLVEHSHPVRFPISYGGVEAPDVLALTVWLNKDLMIARLEAEIDAEADDAAALSDQARKKREAQIIADVLANERLEAVLCWTAMDQAMPCEHRSDINPLALLGIDEIAHDPVHRTQSSHQHTAMEIRGVPRPTFIPPPPRTLGVDPFAIPPSSHQQDG